MATTKAVSKKFNYQGKTALITGASSGIGEVFARKLAALGTNLVLVARSQEKLQTLATELAQKHHIKAEVIAVDLSQEEAASQLYQITQERKLSVDILVNNAGFGSHGLFEELDGSLQHQEVMLNVTTVVDLSHLFLPYMQKQGEGAIINVASTAAFQPVPFMAVYAATKAFVLSFSEALWAENRRRGVRVLALCPGATETAFFGVAGEDAALGKRSTPEHVVEIGLRALGQNRSYVIPGANNFIMAQSSRFSPRSLTVRLVEQMMKPR